jgi:hypothetical protein
VLEFFARNYPPAWLLLSGLEQEVGGSGGIGRATECMHRYLESQPPAAKRRAARQRLVTLYRAMGHVVRCCGAFLKAADLVEPPLNEVSSIANWLNTAPELKIEMDVVARGALFKPLARLMEAQVEEASAIDLSRSAWLHLRPGTIIAR